MYTKHMAKGFIVTNRKKKIALIPTEDSFSIDCELLGVKTPSVLN